MSCINCDIAQGKGTDGLYGRQLNSYTFVRVGPANVLIAGCDEHLKKLINKLRGNAKNGEK